MAYETIILENEGAVRIITLNRPERLNALNSQLFSELAQIIGELERDQGCLCVIITGAGRGFCAGADIKEMAKTRGRPSGDRGSTRFSIFNRLEEFGKPVVAAINGPCNGGGLELALCCDFRLASQAASFGLGEVKLGVIPAAGGTARLPRLIGPARAREFLYFGNVVPAEEAYRLGIINRVVAREDLMYEAKKWASELAERPPLSLRMLKNCLNTGLQMSLQEAIDYESKCLAILARTEDRIEGMRAFVEKRKPVFKGR
jgi:enoyl-CoA hydratase